MAERTKINMNELEKVTGGVSRTVNTGVDGLDAALRADSRKGSKQIGHLPNGTVVEVISDTLVYDPESGRHFVEISVNGTTGWIASSILGLKR